MASLKVTLELNLHFSTIIFIDTIMQYIYPLTAFNPVFKLAVYTHYYICPLYHITTICASKAFLSETF